MTGGLPEVISTTNGTAYLHLPGVILAQNAAGQRVYLLSDGLGSIRQVISGTEVVGWREYEPYGQPRATSAFTDTFTASLEGWTTYSFWSNPGVLSNPPGLMRLASGGNPSGITVRKPLSGGPGTLTISTVFTVASYTTVSFWVEYADGSVDYIFSNGTTPPGTYTPGYTTPLNKVAVALYFYAAASGAFPPYQVDIDEVRVTPASTAGVVASPPYGFSGEWWEQDVQLLHLRARWYASSDGIFLSRDPIESEPPYLYVRGNPINLTDPTGYQGVPEMTTGGGLLVACVLATPACAAAIEAGAVVVVVTGAVVIIYVTIDYAMQHPELARPTYPPGIGPRPAPAPPIAPPFIGTPSACYWSADGCKPVSAIQRPQPQQTPSPYPIPYNRRLPTPPPTCTPTPDTDPRRLVELGTGFESIPGTMAFEILYNEYEDDFDEFVSVDKLGQVELLKMQGRLPNSSHIYEIETTSKVPNNFANFLFAMSPGPMSLAPEIVQHASRIQKSNATVWFILDSDTYGPYPDIIKYLEREKFTIIRHDKGDKLSEKNILKLPFQSAWIPPGSEWIEAYKGPGIP